MAGIGAGCEPGGVALKNQWHKGFQVLLAADGLGPREMVQRPNHPGRAEVEVSSLIWLAVVHGMARPQG